MEPHASFEVNCNWFTQLGSTLRDCIVWRFEEGDDASEEGFQVSNIFLNNDSSDQDRPTLSVSPKNHVKTPFIITAIDILCSARNMEIFGAKQEYLGTSPGMKLHLEDAPNNTDVYMLQYSFDEPVPSCQVKLVSLHNKTSLWIHSFHITVQPHSVASATPIIPELSPKIDVSKVKSILSEMGQDIPANANSLLSAMEAMQNAQKGQNERLGAALGNMLSSLSLNSGTAANLPSTSKDNSRPQTISMQDTSTSQIPSTLLSLLSMGNAPDLAKLMSMNKEKNGESCNDSSSGDNPSFNSSSKSVFNNLMTPKVTDAQLENSTDLKTYLEELVKQEIVQCETRLMSNMEQLINQSEQRLSAKLDLILDKLTKKDP